MPNINFTVEEINLIDIFKTDTLAETLTQITAAYSYMSGDMLTIAESAARKLTALTEPEFAALSFVSADESEGNDYE
jgi:hypothetical protein